MEYDPCLGSTLVEEILCRHKLSGFKAKIYISEAWRLLKQLLEKQGVVLDDAVVRYIRHYFTYVAAKYMLDEDVAAEIAEAIVNYLLAKQRG